MACHARCSCMGVVCSGHDAADRIWDPRWRFRILLRGLSVHCGFRAIWSAILREIVGLALPRGGGDVARLAWLSQHTGRSDAVVAVGWVLVFELAPWMLLLFYGLGWGLMTWHLVGTVALLVGIGFATVLGVAAWYYGGAR